MHWPRRAAVATDHVTSSTPTEVRMKRLRSPSRQLGLRLDHPEVPAPDEEIREAVVQALAELLCEALDVRPIAIHPQPGASHEPEVDA